MVRLPMTLNLNMMLSLRMGPIYSGFGLDMFRCTRTPHDKQQVTAHVQCVCTHVCTLYSHDTHNC